MECYVVVDKLDHTSNNIVSSDPPKPFESLVKAKEYCETQIRSGQQAIKAYGVGSETVPVRMRVRAEVDGKLMYEYYGRIVK